MNCSEMLLRTTPKPEIHKNPKSFDFSKFFHPMQKWNKILKAPNSVLLKIYFGSCICCPECSRFISPHTSLIFPSSTLVLFWKALFLFQSYLSHIFLPMILIGLALVQILLYTFPWLPEGVKMLNYSSLSFVINLFSYAEGSWTFVTAFASKTPCTLHRSIDHEATGTYLHFCPAWTTSWCIQSSSRFNHFKLVHHP